MEHTVVSIPIPLLIFDQLSFPSYWVALASIIILSSRVSLKRIYIEKIFTAYMPVIYKTDVLLGLPFSMLVAVGPTSDIGSVFNLLKEYPAVVNITSQRHTSIFTDNTIKRGKA